MRRRGGGPVGSRALKRPPGCIGGSGAVRPARITGVPARHGSAARAAGRIRAQAPAARLGGRMRRAVRYGGMWSTRIAPPRPRLPGVDRSGRAPPLQRRDYWCSIPGADGSGRAPAARGGPGRIPAGPMRERPAAGHIARRTLPGRGGLDPRTRPRGVTRRGPSGHGRIRPPARPGTRPPYCPGVWGDLIRPSWPGTSPERPGGGECGGAGAARWGAAP